MSFTIPGIQAAAISTQVWADKHEWKLHDVESDIHTPPTQNDWYTIFDLDEGILLHYLAIYQNNTDTDDKDIEIRATIDGVTYPVLLKTCSVAEYYYLSLIDIGQAPPVNLFELQNGVPIKAFGFEDEGDNAVNAVKGVRARLPVTDFKLEYRMTHLAGTAQTLRCYYRRSSKEAV